MNVAIIGASKNRQKYGNKAVRAWLKKGHKVFPVNPKEKTIEGLPCYSSVLEVNDKIDVISIYVPPKVGLTLVNQLASVNAGLVYLNPGAESDDLIEALKEKEIPFVLACSIVAAGMNPSEL
jgi:hypothetical protein